MFFWKIAFLYLVFKNIENSGFLEPGELNIVCLDKKVYRKGGYVNYVGTKFDRVLSSVFLIQISLIHYLVCSKVHASVMSSKIYLGETEKCTMNLQAVMVIH